MSRPFEVGDLVMSTIGIGVVVSFYKNKKVVEVEINENTYYFSIATGKECNFSSAVEFDDGEIKTIRHPRKGNAESRAIVAMLARRYKNAVIKNWKKVKSKKDTSLHIIYKSWDVSGRDSYKKAKSMLK